MVPSSGYSRFVTRVYRWIWMGRIHSPRPDIPPGTLILAAHYNGLVDGFVYGSQSPPARGIISVQWHRHLLGRLLFPGIPVQRAKDGSGGAGNLQAFRRMTAALAEGDRLLFFPEGTSRLGPARLPIAPGTLLLLRNLRRQLPATPVVFCAAHYHTPTRWRCHVSLGWIGPLALPTTPDDDLAWIESNLLQAQTLAYAQPPHRRLRLTPVAALIAAPFLPWWWTVGRLARRIADEDNVISLWKFLIGVPVTLLVLILYTAVAAALGAPIWLPAISLLGGAALWNQ